MVYCSLNIYTERGGNMNTVLLFGSPRKHGITAGMTARLLDGTTHTAFDAYQLSAKPCTDCRGCYAGPCVHRDLDDFYAALEQADRLVIATPVYHLSFPAPLKAILDRTQPYWAARFVRGVRPPIAVPKQVIVLSHAEKDAHAGELLIKQLAPALTVLNARIAATVHCTADGNDLPDDIAVKLDRIKEEWLR